jgi:hypothetical protein
VKLLLSAVDVFEEKGMWDEKVEVDNPPHKREGKPMTTEELREKCEELQAEHMKAWEFLHGLVSDAGMPGHHAVFFDFPIKSHSLEVYQNIYSVIEAVIEHREKQKK